MIEEFNGDAEDGDINREEISVDTFPEEPPP